MKKVFSLLFIISSGLVLAQDAPPPPSEQAGSLRDIFSTQRMFLSRIPEQNKSHTEEPRALSPNSSVDEFESTIKADIKKAKKAIKASEEQFERVRVTQIRRKLAGVASRLQKSVNQSMQRVEGLGTPPGTTPRSDSSIESTDNIITGLREEIEQQANLIESILEENEKLKSLRLNLIKSVNELHKESQVEGENNSLLEEAILERKSLTTEIQENYKQIQNLQNKIEELNEKLELEKRLRLDCNEELQHQLKLISNFSKVNQQLETSYSKTRTLLSLEKAELNKEQIKNAKLESELAESKQENSRQIAKGLNLANDKLELESKFQRLEKSKNKWKFGAIVSGTISALGLIIYAIKNAASSNSENNKASNN